MTRPSNYSEQQIATRLRRVETLLEQQSAPSLANSSMEGGSVEVYVPGTKGGQLGSQVGEQFDGTYGAPPLAGPPPGQPTAPTFRVIGDTAFISWDGGWVDSPVPVPVPVATLDFKETEVHVGPADMTGLEASTLRRPGFTTGRGGEIAVVGLQPDTDYWACLTARSQSGKPSKPSALVGPFQVHALDLSKIGGNTIFEGPDAPDGDLLIGDLWLQRTSDGPPPLHVTNRWDGDSWEPVQDQKVTQALEDAFAAQQTADTANQAGIDALAAAATAQSTATNAATAAQAAKDRADSAVAQAATAQATADGKVVTYFQTSPPTGKMAGDDGDLWFDTDDSNRMYRWNGSSLTWVLADDQRIAAAVTAAANAATAAGTAQTTANSKIVTFYAGTAPSATGQVAGNLWVDTANGNRLNRWSGSAWVAVQLGAPAISATARQLGSITTYRQSTAPTSGMVANDLWIDSDDNSLWSYSGTAWVASQDAGIQQALTAAGTANTTVATKTTVFYQPTTAPSTTGRTKGDLWVDTANANRISTWSGTAWVLTQFGAAAISATARQLGAITTYKQSTAPSSGMIVGDFWIDSDDNVIYRYEGSTPTWVKSQDVNINTAISNAATAQATADGKMRIFTQTTAPVGLLASDVGDMWIDISTEIRADGTTGPKNTTYTWELISGTTYGWKARLVSGTQIQPKSLVARDIIATGTVSAALLEAMMILTSTLIVGTAGGNRLVISGDPAVGVGMQLITNGQVTFNLTPGGAPYFAGVLSGQSSNYQEATSGWSIDPTGRAAFQNIQVLQSLNAQSGSFTSLTVKGRTLDAMLSDRPLGLISQGFTDTLNAQGVTLETGLVEIGFPGVPARGYRVSINGGAFAASDINTVIGFLMRYTNDGSAPNVNSPALAPLGHLAAGPTPEGQYISRTLDKSFLWYPLPAVDVIRPIRLALSFYKERGGGSVGCNTTGIRLQVFVEDVGPALPNSIRINGFTAAAPPAPPAPPIQQYQKTFYSTWGATYRSGGSRWSENETGWGYQGYGDSYNGDQISLHGFDINDIRTSLAGATLQNATFYARAGHTWDAGGGVMLLGSHGNDTMPADGNGIIALQERRSTTPVQSGGWAGVDATGVISDITGYRASGFTFGRAGNTNTSNYAYFYQYPHTDRPRVVVNYTK